MQYECCAKRKMPNNEWEKEVKGVCRHKSKSIQL